MAPRKRAKASAVSTPLASTQPRSPRDLGVAQSPDGDVQPDPWADEQETQLFKSTMKWKPTGLHKHFRMISIHNDMRSHGYATEDAPHTRIPGIWAKLHELYDLEVLDAREIEFAFSEEPDPTDPDEAGAIPEFELPEDEFGELMWQQRFHREESAAASSPPQLPTDDKALYVPGMGLLKHLPEGQRSQKAEDIAGATPVSRNAKSTRSNRPTARTSKAAKATASAAKNSKAQPAVSESADEEDEEGDEEGSNAESAEESAPVTRRTNRGRAKPTPRRSRRR